jgi:hypothetical protein
LHGILALNARKLSIDAEGQPEPAAFICCGHQGLHRIVANAQKMVVLATAN